MGQFISPEELAPFATIEEAKALAMIEDAESMAVHVAPCIAEDDFASRGVVKAILRGAILRWHDSGSGAVISQSKAAGPYSESKTIDTTRTRKSLFWPSEIEQLQDICSPAKGGAFSIDTAPTGYGTHSETCSLAFGATYCSCGASLTGGYPLWGSP